MATLKVLFTLLVLVVIVNGQVSITTASVDTRGAAPPNEAAETGLQAPQGTYVISGTQYNVMYGVLVTNIQNISTFGLAIRQIAAYNVSALGTCTGYIGVWSPPAAPTIVGASTNSLNPATFFSNVTVGNPANFTWTFSGVSGLNASLTYMLYFNCTNFVLNNAIEISPIRSNGTYGGNSANSYVPSSAGNAGFTNWAYDSTVHFPFEYAQTSGGGGGGDPHFNGFRGQQFDFQGLPGKVFNLYSNPSVQVNALFSKVTYDNYVKLHAGDSTYITAFGVRCGPVDQVLYYRQPYSLSVSEHTETPSGARLSGGTEIVWNADRVSVKIIYEDMILSVSRMEGNHPDGTKQHFFDFQIKVGNLTGTKAAGVLGQTLSLPANLLVRSPNGEGFLDGEMSDYIVEDGLLGTKFAFNAFEGVDVEEHIHNHTENDLFSASSVSKFPKTH